MVQPNPEARPRRPKPRGSEEHAPLVEPQAPPGGVTLHGVYSGSISACCCTVSQAWGRQEDSQVDQRDSISIVARSLRVSLITFRASELE